MWTNLRAAMALVMLWLSIPAWSATVEVAAILRTTGSGWFILKDSEHKPLRVTSVVTDSQGIRLNFDFTATQVRTFIVGVDETYATSLGLVCGASVGLSYAYIQCRHQGGIGAAHPDSLNVPGSNLWVWGLFEDGK